MYTIVYNTYLPYANLRTTRVESFIQVLMLEHDAKEVLSTKGIPAPLGVLTNDPGLSPPFTGPWFVKAQIPVGGRGKEGGIRRAETSDDLSRALAQIIGMRIKGHSVNECRVEIAVSASYETYISLHIDPQLALVRMLVSPVGGVEVEQHSSDSLIITEAHLDPLSLTKACDQAVETLPLAFRTTVRSAAKTLSSVFLELDATLLEINPLLILEDGSWIAGDAKLIIDDNAFVRQPTLHELVKDRAHAYPEVAFKFDEGFDFVVLDHEGEVGLVTTGAGLSMQLIDELVSHGIRPFNFCDLRSSRLRGDPSRLIGILKRFAGSTRIRVVLVNIFAGITDLAEFSRLLLAALRAVPALKVPVIVRLTGNGEEKVAAHLQGYESTLIVEPDLDRCVLQIARIVSKEYTS